MSIADAHMKASYEFFANPQAKEDPRILLVDTFVRWVRQYPGVRAFCDVPFNADDYHGVVDVVAIGRPLPALPWMGMACVLTPLLTDLGATIQNVRMAERHFHLPRHLFPETPVVLRFHLAVEATDRNLATLMRGASLLDGVEVFLFSRTSALVNPHQKAWEVFRAAKA